MKLKIYGSLHCVTCLKPKNCLESNQLTYKFIDLEQQELTMTEAEELCNFDEMHAEQLFVTWSEAFKDIQVDLTSISKKQLALLCKQYKELLRRPLIIIDEVLFVGYNEHLMDQLILIEYYNRRGIDTILE